MTEWTYEIMTTALNGWTENRGPEKLQPLARGTEMIMRGASPKLRVIKRCSPKDGRTLGLAVTVDNPLEPGPFRLVREGSGKETDLPIVPGEFAKIKIEDATIILKDQGAIQFIFLKRVR
jgi:hypothetical protein